PAPARPVRAPGAGRGGRRAPSARPDGDAARARRPGAVRAAASAGFPPRGGGVEPNGRRARGRRSGGGAGRKTRLRQRGGLDWRSQLGNNSLTASRSSNNSFSVASNFDRPKASSFTPSITWMLPFPSLRQG